MTSTPEAPVRQEARRQRMGGNGSEHFDEVDGSSEFFIYVAPNMSTKGYTAEELPDGLGCEVEFPAVAPLSARPRHEASRSPMTEELIPDGANGPMRGRTRTRSCTASSALTAKES